MIEIWWLFVLAALAVVVIIGVAVYMDKRGKLTPEASAALARVLAGDFHAVDDFYKATAAYPAVKKRYAEVIAALEAARARAATAAGSAAASGVASGVASAVESAVEHFIPPQATRVGPKAAPARATAPAPATPAAPMADIPAALPGEGLETYAARAGIDVAAMRLLAGLHPADAWEQLADRIRNPSRYFTDADHDTVAAAASTAGLAVNR